MKEPLLKVIKRKIKQLLCFKHDWYYWVDKKHKSCKKCDVTEVVRWKKKLSNCLGKNGLSRWNNN